VTILDWAVLVLIIECLAWMLWEPWQCYKRSIEYREEMQEVEICRKRGWEF
jgi:hypothetical protein